MGPRLPAPHSPGMKGGSGVWGLMWKYCISVRTLRYRGTGESTQQSPAVVSGRGRAGTGWPASVGSGRSRAAQPEGWRQDGSPGALLQGSGVPGCPAGRQAGSVWLAASPAGTCHSTLDAVGAPGPVPSPLDCLPG